ncbi:hypothetical protein KC19_VG136900 [Ceratodon purpureus]|nr:hypothetical protein KC19_VG136900 [Ceratodon purpureus]
MPFLRKKVAGWQLEIFYNSMFESFWPKMRVLLKTWAENRRFEPQIMQHLAQYVKRPIDESYSSLQQTDTGTRKRYRTCAVVGNSGILLNSSYGGAIDQHEMVMRINNARTVGFEVFVGRKTTISFMNSHIIRTCAKRSHCWCHPYGAIVPIITYLCAPWHFMPIAFCSSEHRAPLLVTDPRFDNLCNRIAKWYSVKLFLRRPNMKPGWWSILRNPKRQFHYSTGMQGVMMALGLCDNVHVYGFGKATGLKHHYFSQQSEELKEIHDYKAEYEFYHDLEHNNTQLLPFFKAAGITSLPNFRLLM